MVEILEFQTIEGESVLHKKKHSGEETERNLLNEYKCRSTQPCPGGGQPL